MCNSNPNPDLYLSSWKLVHRGTFKPVFVFLHLCFVTVVFMLGARIYSTLVKGGIQGLTRQKTAKIIKRWYYSAAHWHTVNVMQAISPFWFLLFLMCWCLSATVKGSTQKLTHQKTAKIIRRWYYSAAHWHTVYELLFILWVNSKVWIGGFSAVKIWR